ncbi:MAG: uncharacterized protein A8A55_1333 [Amphiamblys sp. WSBS2006]|nr:MAG: uncharacterized protein A8A55_1333 [Amphiamblys sp. WSBS2006]
MASGTTSGNRKTFREPGTKKDFRRAAIVSFFLPFAVWRMFLEDVSLSEQLGTITGMSLFGILLFSLLFSGSTLLIVLDNQTSFLCTTVAVFSLFAVSFLFAVLCYALRKYKRLFSNRTCLQSAV